MTWHCTPHSHQSSGPVVNDDEPLLVVPNDRGGWSLRFTDSKTLIGHYSSVDEAVTYAHTQCQYVRVIAPAQQSQTSHRLLHPASFLEAKGTTLIRS